MFSLVGRLSLLPKSEQLPEDAQVGPKYVAIDMI
jgi:hypothetical protein